MFIVIVLKRKSSYYIIAEIWLKQNKIMSGIWCESLCGRVMERVGKWLKCQVEGGIKR